MDDQKDWFEYRRLILSELQRISGAVESVDAKIDRLRSEEIGMLKIEVAMLKVKASMWGGLVGALTGLATAVGVYLTSKGGN